MANPVEMDMVAEGSVLVRKPGFLGHPRQSGNINLQIPVPL